MAITMPIVLIAILTTLLFVVLPGIRIRVALPFTDKTERLENLGYTKTALWSVLSGFLFAVHLAVGWLALCKFQYGIATAAVVLAWVGAAKGLRIAIEKRERLLRNQVALAATVMAGGVRAGMSPAMAMSQAASDSPVPLAPQLRRIIQDYNRGAPLRTALSTAANRLSLDAFSLLVAAVGVTMDCGGRLDEALDRIAESISDQQRLEDKLDAATASSRQALVVMALFPFAFTALSYRLNPGGFDAISSTVIGQVGICGIILLVYVALRWGNAIIDKVSI